MIVAANNNPKTDVTVKMELDTQIAKYIVTRFSNVTGIWKERFSLNNKDVAEKIFSEFVAMEDTEEAEAALEKRIENGEFLPKKYVYIVKRFETEDTIPTVHVEVFETETAAKKYFDETVAEVKADYGMDDYGTIEDETDDLFSWTANVGFTDDTIELTIEKVELRA